jgi:hypothetical protein
LTRARRPAQDFRATTGAPIQFMHFLLYAFDPAFAAPAFVAMALGWLTRDLDPGVPPNRTGDAE